MEPKDEIIQQLRYSENVKKKLELGVTSEKKKFIHDIVNGLGSEIKENKGKVIVRKKSVIERLKIIINSFFMRY